MNSKLRGRKLYALLALALLLPACGGPQAPGEGGSAPGQTSTQGRVAVVNQNSNSMSVIDVATSSVSATVQTGKQPHHVLVTPDGKELWVTLYGENRLQVFDAATLKEVASPDLASANDDLVFDAAGKRLYVSLGKQNSVAVIDVASRRLLGKITVGKTPHGLRVTPDGKYLLASNTQENSLSVVALKDAVEEIAVEATIKTGANPFEVVVSADGKTAYVSNFLGDSLSIIDLEGRKTAGYIRSGKKPAMLSLEGAGGSEKIWVANTGSNDLWLIDAATRKLITRIPVGSGAHGALPLPSGKLYVTNTEDGTISVVDQAQATVVATIRVGQYPNGLTFLPAGGADGN